MEIRPLIQTDSDFPSQGRQGKGTCLRRQALEAGDASALQEQAHSIKGAAASLSADAVRQAAGNLESAGKNQNLEEAPAFLEALTQEFARFQEVLKK